MTRIPIGPSTHRKVFETWSTVGLRPQFSTAPGEARPLDQVSGTFRTAQALNWAARGPNPVIFESSNLRNLRNLRILLAARSTPRVRTRMVIVTRV